VNDQITELYKLPDIDQYEDLHLLTLSESCKKLEEQVYRIAQRLPENQRQAIASYISLRDDLEVETIKTALRWGKRHIL
jgi:hypothetical protein